MPVIRCKTCYGTGKVEESRHSITDGWYSVVRDCPDCTKKEKLYFILSEQLIDLIDRRIKYIQNKLSGCCGYSDKEKYIRIEELNFIKREITGNEII